MGVFCMKKIVKIFDVVLALCCAVIFSFVAIGNYTMPDSIVSYDESDNDLSSFFSYSGDVKTQSVDYQNATTSCETIKLLGVVPVKDVSVTNKKASQVYVSGEAFGIKLYTDGVIVVGTQSVELDNTKVNPAEEAGIEVGDIIISINNVNVYSSTEVTSALNDNNGKPYKIKVKRDGRYKTFTLTPVYSNREGCYKAGMWVRDSTAGIGTITFFNEQSGTFAALGHQINDVDTNELMPLLQGEAVGASVTSVQKATSGTTGSLVCNFEDYTIGMLSENTDCGVYGSYSSIDENCKLYTVASAQQVQKGSAQIISTVDSGQPKAYDIEITHINYSSNGEKDIVFKVTDDELIEKTGGIVQGMSGSPIIQNNMLVGAVTHVIINNPEKGYAIFAQTMFEESNAVE
jgi:stage IV sporulation protein B